MASKKELEAELVALQERVATLENVLLDLDVVFSSFKSTIEDDEDDEE